MINSKIKLIPLLQCLLSLLIIPPSNLLSDITIVEDLNSHKYLQNDSDKNSLRNRAEELIASGASDKAIKIYEEIVRNYPDDVDALKRLAEIFAWNNQLSNSISCLEKVIQKDSADVSSMRKLAQFYTWNNQQNQAIEIHEHLLKYEPENQELRQSLAQLYSWNNMPEEAIIEYEKIVQVDSTNTKILKLLAQQYFWNERPEDGIRLLEKLVVYEPDSTEWRRQLAQQYLWSGKQDRAIEEYIYILSIKSSDNDSKKQLALLYRWNDRPDECMILLEELTYSEPSNMEYCLLLSESQYYAGEFFKAKQNIELVLEKDKDNIRAFELLSLIDKLHSPSIKLGYTKLSDSNNLILEQIPLIYTFYQPINWKYSTNLIRKNIVDNRVKATINGYSLIVNSQYNFSSIFAAKFDLGMSFYSSDWKPLNYGLRFDYHYGGINTNLEYSHHELLQGANAITEEIVVDEINVQSFFQATADWSINLIFNYGTFSDSNKNILAIIATNYIILHNLPLVMITGFYSYENFRYIYESSLPYWTPKNLNTFSMGLQASQRFWSSLQLYFFYGLTSQQSTISHNYRVNCSYHFFNDHQIIFLFEKLGSVIYNSHTIQMSYQYSIN